MLDFFRRYWIRCIAATGPIYGILQWIKWFFDWRSRYDALAESYAEIGGWRSVIGHLMNPPSWAPLAATVIGFLVILWHVKRVAKDSKAPYLSDSIIVAGLDNAPPEYRARFSRDGSNAIFYAEYSVCSPIGWTQPRKIKAFNASRFAAGELISFPIVHKCATKEGTRWRIGLPDEEDIKNGTLRDILNGNAQYRGRITLLTPDNLSQHCYFILWTDENREEMPHARGEHMFSHMFEWEGQTPPNGNHRSLFK